jgi:hypothetical protein
MYYIYHIANVKIGCSTEPERRVNKQGYTEFEILEQHTDIDIADKREKELQIQYGYKVDTVPYSISRKHWGSKAGKVGGNTHSDLRNKACSELGKRTGKKNALLMIKNRRSYEGEGNHKCKITQIQAQEILDYYNKLVNSGHRKYGLLTNVVNNFSNISKRIVLKICLRQTWKHLS